MRYLIGEGNLMAATLSPVFLPVLLLSTTRGRIGDEVAPAPPARNAWTRYWGVLVRKLYNYRRLGYRTCAFDGSDRRRDCVCRLVRGGNRKGGFELMREGEGVEGGGEGEERVSTWKAETGVSPHLARSPGHSLVMLPRPEKELP